MDKGDALPRINRKNLHASGTLFQVLLHIAYCPFFFHSLKTEMKCVAACPPIPPVPYTMSGSRLGLVVYVGDGWR